MKKTLVALAALAATGAFAQVSITGKLGFSYQKAAIVSTPAVPSGPANQGLAMTDGNLTFTATEDLGGGMKATAKTEFASRGRDNTFAPRDGSLSLTTPVGLLTLGSVESCSSINNVAGAPVSLATGHDNGSAPLDPCANLDMVGFNVPVGPVVLGALYADSLYGAGAGSVANAVSSASSNVNAILSGSGTSITATQVSAKYAAGALALGLDHTVYAASGGTTPAALVARLDSLTRTRLTASYDLGMAVIGAGFQVNNHDKAPQSSLSVKVPMGAVSVGLAYALRQGQSASAAYGFAAEGSRSATAVGLQYDLSKQTNVNVSYGTYSADAGVQLENEFRIRLMKSF